jgi:hypothetical protein
MPLITAIERMLFADSFPLAHLSLASIAPQKTELAEKKQIK